MAIAGSRGIDGRGGGGARGWGEGRRAFGIRGGGGGGEGRCLQNLRILKKFSSGHASLSVLTYRGGNPTPPHPTPPAFPISFCTTPPSQQFELNTSSMRQRQTEIPPLLLGDNSRSEAQTHCNANPLIWAITHEMITDT